MADHVSRPAMKTLTLPLTALLAVAAHAQAGEDMLAGMAAMRQQDHAKAEESFSRAVTESPDDMKTWYYRAVNRIGLGDIGGALRDLDHALALEPSDAHSLLRRAEVKAGMGAEHSAMADLHHLLSVRPTGPAAEHALLHLGHFAMGRRDYLAAKAHYDQLIAIAPYNPYGWCDRGIVLATLKHDDDALGDLERAIELDPTLDQAQLQRAMILIRMDRKQDACEALHAAHSLGNNSVEEMLLIYCE